MNTIQGLVFDAYGTLLDVYSIGRLAEQLYPGSGAALGNLWRDKQIEYSRLVSLSDPQPQGSRHYASFWALTEAALRYSLERLQLDGRDTLVQQLMNQYARLDAFPECQAVLRTLSKADLPMAVLSNGSPDMLQSALDHAGLSPHMHHLISVDGVRQFKTHPAAYALACSTLNLPKENLLFVSSNGWDVMGAGWFGFSTCWINRAGLPFETIGPRPTLMGQDLSVVLSAI
ncbi:haloacid dehalogenase type II [Limnobacter humi]|uniref:(S)-2-haloacid dehalogenase n=1 Tax=Limnobacter humi TaxID=1778671 RepID=A0ABT1WGZ7_9BURK|nr:haloacid dehalogenase type II [Limnobacter humi]MCQ8896788.1 haloacid dehalogenase type II [Limnobacter humi]